MSNVILVFWFCLSIPFGIFRVGFDEAGDTVMSNIFGVATLVVCLGGIILYFIVSEKEK